MKIIKESGGYRLVATESIEYVGNYQILDLTGAGHMPWIFSDIGDALEKFGRLTSQ